MKKIFSFLAAVLFAGSMMATEVVFTNADFAGQGTANTGSEVTATKDGVTFTFSKGYSADESLRCYAHGAMTISAESTIEKINFTTTGGKTGGLDAEVTVGATTYSVADLASQARFTEIKVTLGGETPVEPGDEPVAETVLFKAENVEVSEASVVAAGAVLVDDAALKLENVYESFVSGTNHTYAVTPEYSIEFQKALQVRASTYPAGENLIGENNNTASTADNKKASPLVLTAKEDVDVVFYYRRQSSNTVYEVEGDKNSPIVSVTHDQNDSKDLIVYDQSDIATKMVTENYALADAANEEYAFAVKSFSLTKGHVYTITAKGTTLPLFGFEYVAKASEPEGPKNLGAKTIAEFLELKNTTDTCILTGVVSNIVNTTYGNFDLTDESGKVYVYGLLTPEGESKKFADLNVAEKDTLTVLAIYNEHNGNPQAKNAIFVEVKKSTAPVVEPVNLGAKTIAEFLELKNTKDTCILTGVVSNIQNTTYGNFDLTDESGTVYVYGLLTPEGESKKFADLNVAEKDTLTVLAIYNEYNGNPQAKNAIFVEVKKAAVVAQDVEVTLSYLTTPGSLIWTNAVAEEGWWQIMGESDSYVFSLSNAGAIAEAAGTYTVADLDADYSYISIYGEKDTTDVAFADGSVTVAVSAEGIVTVNGTLVGSDGNNYIFNLTYKDPVAENTVNVAVPEWQLVDDYVAYLGLFAVAGEDANGTYVQLALNMPDGATEIAGDYTEEDFDLQYFGCHVADANGAYRIFSATIKVTTAENGRALVTADILCYNNTLYKVTTTFGEGIDEVNAAVKATKTLKNGQLIIEKAGVKYNAQGAVIR